VAPPQARSRQSRSFRESEGSQKAGRRYPDAPAEDLQAARSDAASQDQRAVPRLPARDRVHRKGNPDRRRPDSGIDGRVGAPRSERQEGRKSPGRGEEAGGGGKG